MRAIVFAVLVVMGCVSAPQTQHWTTLPVMKKEAARDRAQAEAQGLCIEAFANVKRSRMAIRDIVINHDGKQITCKKR